MKFLLPFTRSRGPKSADDQQKSEFTDYMLSLKKQRNSDEDENGNPDEDNDDLDQDYQEDVDEETGDRNSYEDDQTSSELLIERKTAAPIATIPIEAFAMHQNEAGPSSVNGDIVMIENKPRVAIQSNIVKRKAVESETVDSYLTEPKRFEISPVDAKEIEDADINFFKSVLPDIRQLNASQKRRFKMGILELIDNICEKH